MSLELRGISAGYAGVNVIHEISLVVRPREIVTLVGANGAGKSTLLKCISGLISCSGGAMKFNDKNIEQVSTAARMQLGIVHVPEGRQIFSGLTVAENLQLGGFIHWRDSRRADENQAKVLERFPALQERLSETAGNLSGGQQQMLAIGRGLMSQPKLLMLDEPSLGLAPRMVLEIFNLIDALRQQGIAILLSEQNAQLSLAVADRGYVIENGRVVLTGLGQELLQSKEVADRYLGAGAQAKSSEEAKGSELVTRLRDLLRA